MPASFRDLLADLSETVTQLAKAYEEDVAEALGKRVDLRRSARVAQGARNRGSQSGSLSEVLRPTLQLEEPEDLSHRRLRMIMERRDLGDFEDVVDKTSEEEIEPEVNNILAENSGVQMQGPRSDLTKPDVSSNPDSSPRGEEETQQKRVWIGSEEGGQPNQRKGVSIDSDESSEELYDVGRNSTSLSNENEVERHQQFVVRGPWNDASEFENLKLTDVISAERNRAAKTRSDEAFAVLASANNSVCLSEADTAALNTCIFIIHPESRIRGLWVLASMALLIYDMVMVPINVCFNPSPTTFSKAMDMFTMFFWTFDMLLTFITGVRTEEHVESRLTRIACIYAKSWLLFDLVLVGSEWIFLLVDEDSVDADVSILRILRWGRLMRLLRMARILRLRLFVRRVVLVFNLSKVYVHLTQGLVGLSVLLLVFIHMLSCFWYAIGNTSNNGWVKVNEMESATIPEAYIASVHWSFSRLQGLKSQYRMESQWDVLLDGLLIYLSLMLAAYYHGMIAAFSVSRLQDKKGGNLWQLSLLYVKRHKVSSAMGIRLFKFVESSVFAGVSEYADQETTLLQALPTALQEDLLFEARARSLLTRVFFVDMFCSINARVVRHICSKAMTLCVFIEGEAIFSHSDACHRMLFLESGHLHYVDDSVPVYASFRDVSANNGTMQKVTSIGASTRRLLEGSLFNPSLNNCRKLTRGSSFSEPVLWTQWVHIGRLQSGDEAQCLALGDLEFAEVIVEHQGTKGPFMHAARYAKHFVWHLNHCQDIDDLISFQNLSINEINLDLFEGTDTDHFLFISHYKVEAGTEATLMAESFADIMSQDMSHPANDLRSPIFIDSEDLTDLAKLRKHVENTTALVLLLTPGVLSRPWCLIEIVTAVESALDIVPVEIQRPGSSYCYPDEEFYAKLLAGRILSQSSMDLLESENIGLVDVEKAIRQLFLKIALPFSPHKTRAVREAELIDILKRCSGASKSKKSRGPTIGMFQVGQSSRRSLTVPSMT